MADHTCPDCGAVHEEKKRLTLKQRVEELEERVRSLEARPQWSWTSTMPILEPHRFLETTTTMPNITGTFDPNLDA